MNQITQNKIQNNKWILTISDSAISNYYKTLADAERYGSCAVISRNRNPWGYTTISDNGQTHYFTRISSVSDKELDEIVRQDIEARIKDIAEDIESSIYIADCEGTLNLIEVKN